MKPTHPIIPEKELLSAITTALSHYIAETDPYILFGGLLDSLLEMTDSEYGFIGEVFYNDLNQPYLRSYATTDISWSKETRQLFEATERKGMIFSKLDSLYGMVLKTGQLIICNNLTADPRSGGLPVGHPQLNFFMGIPFYSGGEFLGIVGIANRPNGYCKQLAELLQPFLLTCGSLIQAYRNNIKHEQVAIELKQYKQHLLLQDEIIHLGADYEFTSFPPTLARQGRNIILTRKEMKLLEVLVIYRNRTTTSTVIEQHVWPNVIVGESSLRSLIRRLRKKLPELTIQTITGIGYMLSTPE
jgi:hypothetical protein